MPDPAASAPEPLKPESLRRRCNPDDLEFETTADLEEVDLTLGQQRALEALELATGIGGGGYNAFLLGSSSVDLREMASAFLERTATCRETPPDWCYIHNFDDAQRPVAMKLPPGKGTALRDDMAQLVEELKIAIPAAFESEEYQTRHNEIEQGVQQRQSEAFQKLQGEAEEKGMGIIQTPHGFAVAPIREGKVLTKEDFDKLSEEEQKETEGTIAELSEKLRKQLQAAPLMIKEARESQRELDRQTALIAIAAPIAGLKEKWQGEGEVLEYLDEVSEDVLANVGDFQPQPPMMPGLGGLQAGSSFTRYEVNLLVDNSDTDGAPVVYETMPSYMNLIGRIEHLSTFGALVTNFTLIKAGALHRANGGFLVLDAERVLSNPYAWQGLQRALLCGELRIEALDRVISLATTVSLEPEPIPLDLKVVLVGSRLLYFLLSEYVEEFGNLFKVAADFEDEFERTPENVGACARLIATLAARDGLRHFDRSAVARVIDDLGRRVSDTERLSTSVSGTADLLREADFEAGRSQSAVVTADDVQRAIDARRRRLDRIPNRMLEAIVRDIVHIETAGAETGQVNGLSVIQLGELSFGHPTRITATARLGKGEVVDVQREVKLGGAIHSKGVFILASFLGSRYAREVPLSLSASLVFEQTYSQVDGDSASLAESCALLSVLAGVPLAQNLAVTGSIDQNGRVQAVGGVNEKIEGFFRVCEERGLTGDQGVLLPEDNVQHLMLEPKVVSAVESGRFRIYPVGSVDQALELLTGLSAGESDTDGRFPADSVNGRVQQRLDRLADLARRLAVERKEALEDGKQTS